MSRIPVVAIVSLLAVLLAALGGMALAAQDKYTLQLPGGLPFSDFRGYEDWQVVAPSQTDAQNVMRVILANPVMMKAYRRGFQPTASPSPTAPRWRRSIGTRKRTRRPPVSRRCQVPCMTLISW